MTDSTQQEQRTEKKVLVYGASGYTGRLVCEYLREYNVPFIAAGRSEEKLTDSMRSNVAGIETADYEIVTVEHTVEALTELFTGGEVVLNTVGPFSDLGPEVVQACLAAGAHYTDTTGEQDWLITCDEEYGADFAAKGLLLSPGIAHMYTVGEIAAQICLETPGLDTLDIAVFWAAARPSPPPGPSSSTRPPPRPTTCRRTPTSPSRPVPGWCRWWCRASTSWRSRCRGAGPATRCGSSATPAWPAARRRAGSSTRP